MHTMHTCVHACIDRITLPYLTLPYLTLHYIRLPYVTLLYSVSERRSVGLIPYITLHYSTAQYSTVQHSTVQYSTYVTYSIIHVSISLQHHVDTQELLHVNI